MFRTMGERTGVDSSPKVSRRRPGNPSAGFYEKFSTTVPAERSDTRVKVARKPGIVQLKIDATLLLAVITLAIFGLVMVYSASYDYSLSWYGDSGRIFQRQAIWFALGIVVALVVTFLDYHRWHQLSIIAMGATIILLFSVLAVGEVLNNAARTLFEGSVQPSELAKLVMVIYLSVWLYARQEQLHDISFGLVPLAVILGLLGGMIAVQPDFSAVVTIFYLGGVMFFLAGGDLRQIGILLILAMLVGYVIFMVYPTGSTRINDYIAGLKNPTDASYHVRRSFEAFVNGGWLGKGIGKGTVKLTGLPVPHTDSIFAVVGEETGVLGAIAMVGLYAIFLWRGMVISRRAPDDLGALLAAGLTLWITTEAFINMAVMVNLLPFAGNALPFISAGGSNLVVSMASVGILLNISRLSEQRREESGKQFNAVVNLRGRDRRRGVSSPRRPANHRKRG